jgi:PTS system mannitol-specific IIC component
MKKLDQSGRFLSQLVFQNISGLLALGFLRILFAPSGWFPHEGVYQIVDFIVLYFIPIQFANTGGKMIGGQRGGVIASFVMVGLVAGNTTSYSMILPSMCVGPIIGYLIKKTDQWLERRTPPGYELLIYNGAAGLVGTLTAVVCYLYVGPLFARTMQMIYQEALLLAQSQLLPLISVIIEPSKLFFFNNVINHGILEPLGIQETKVNHKSIFFLLESNPGPGFGLLLAFYLKSKGQELAERRNLKSSMFIQLFGGIHELYFPYALMKPLVILPLIVAGAAGNFIFYMFESGLVATPSPGSIIVLLVLAPLGEHVGIIVGFAISVAVSFIGCMFVLSVRGAQVNKQSANKPIVVSELSVYKQHEVVRPMKKVAFACDAGMASSAMGAALFKKKLREKNIKSEVVNCSVDRVPVDADIVVAHSHLIERARQVCPGAEFYPLVTFLDDALYERIMERIVETDEYGEEDVFPFAGGRCIITTGHVIMEGTAQTKWQAIDELGELLYRLGHISPGYIEEMKEREFTNATYLGNQVAIPHGISADSSNIRSSGLVVGRYPDGIDFGKGEIAHLVFALAIRGSDQLSVLSQLAYLIEDKHKIWQLLHSTSRDEVADIINRIVLYIPGGEKT